MALTPDSVESASDSQGSVLDAAEGSEQGAAGQSPEPSDDEILEAARKRFLLCEEAEREIRARAIDDLEFIAGEQWPQDARALREEDGRPCLTINRLPQFVQQITNDHRQNRPDIKINAVDLGANDETAEVIEGLVRHIQYDSNAEVAYDTGMEGAARGGFGYWRVASEYAGADTFDQDVKIKRIRNAFSVRLDPYAQEPDGSDANFGFIEDDVSKDEYKAQYPQSELAGSGADWNSFGNEAPGWVNGESVRVAEYFTKETKPVTLHLLSTGETVPEENLLERLAQAQAAGLQVHTVRSRLAKKPVIKWYKINGVEILERGECPGSYIPIIPIYGNELIVNGKRILEGVIRHAKDSQRMYNYWASAETETIALAPRAPWIGAEGQFEGHPEWKTANRRNHSYLEYKPTTIAGQPVAAPQRNTFEPPVQAISQARMLAADDMKATTGIYDSSTGAQSNEIAGVAIKSRAGQAQTANFHFTDNLKRSLRHTGKILLQWIPTIYDTARAARIIGADGEQKIVSLNQEHADESGKKVLYDLSVGRYDVNVYTGPSYATKREEAAASMMDFSRAVPEVAKSCADIIAKNMDWPGAQELADRLRKMLPPALQDDPKKAQIPVQVQAQMAQMGQMLDSMKKELDEATKVIETKQLELSHKERIEVWRLQQEAEIAMAKMGSTESIELLRHQIGELESRMKYLQPAAPIGAPDDFDPNQADGGNYAGIGHIGGSANIPGGETPGMPTGGQSPGQSMEGPQTP